MLEFDPPIEDAEVDVVPPLLVIDWLDVAAAIGADTLVVEGGRGRATVRGPLFCSGTGRAGIEVGTSKGRLGGADGA